MIMETVIKTAGTGIVAGSASAAGGAMVNQIISSSENSSNATSGSLGISIKMNTNLEKMLLLFRTTFNGIDCLQQMMVENKVNGIMRIFKKSTITIQPSSGDNTETHIPLEPVAVAMDIAINYRENDQEHPEVTFLRKVIMSIFELKDEQMRWETLQRLPSFIERSIGIVERNAYLYYYNDFKSFNKMIPEIIHRVGILGSIATPIPEFDELILDLLKWTRAIHTALRNLVSVIFEERWQRSGCKLILSPLADIKTLRDLLKRDSLGIAYLSENSKPVINTPTNPMEFLINASDKMIQLFLQLWQSVATNNITQKKIILEKIAATAPFIASNITSHNKSEEIVKALPPFFDPRKRYATLSKDDIKEMNDLFSLLMYQVVPLMAQTALMVELIMTLYHYARNLRLACCMDETVKQFLEIIPKYVQLVRKTNSFIFLFRCHWVVKKVCRAKLGRKTEHCLAMQAKMETVAGKYLQIPADQIERITTQISNQIHDVNEPHAFKAKETSYEEIWFLMLTIADCIINNKDMTHKLEKMCEKVDHDHTSMKVATWLKDHSHQERPSDHTVAPDQTTFHIEGCEESKANTPDDHQHVVFAYNQVSYEDSFRRSEAEKHSVIEDLHLALEEYINYSLDNRSELMTAIDPARPHSNEQIKHVVKETFSLARRILDGTVRVSEALRELEKHHGHSNERHSISSFFSDILRNRDTLESGKSSQSSRR